MVGKEEINWMFDVIYIDIFYFVFNMWMIKYVGNKECWRKRWYGVLNVFCLFYDLVVFKLSKMLVLYFMYFIMKRVIKVSCVYFLSMNFNEVYVLYLILVFVNNVFVFY